MRLFFYQISRLTFIRRLTESFLAVLLLLTVGETAWGHAVVVESSPAQGVTLQQFPEQLLLRFNVNIERAFTRATITGPDGRAIPLSIPAEKQPAATITDRLVIPLPSLPPGSYLIRYKIMAVDGHMTEGALRFSVSKPDTGP
jgi:methionine-rich copper-binding protein CopC